MGAPSTASKAAASLSAAKAGAAAPSRPPARAAVRISGLKIDLTKLFGGGDALTMAARERDVELVRDGRDAVGLTVGIPRRQEGKPAGPKDDLDKLMDALDEIDI